jgi:hypothetical protein
MLYALVFKHAAGALAMAVWFLSQDRRRLTCIACE